MLPDVIDVEDFRELIVNVLCDLLNVLLFVDGSRRTAIARLHLQCVEPEALGSVGEVRDLSVAVQAKDTRASKERDFLDGDAELFHVSRVGDDVIMVRAREEELLVLVEDELTEELLKVGVHNAAIPVISDTTTVHGLTNQVAQCLPRQVLLLCLDCLVKVQSDEAPRDIEVTVVEVILDVPTDLTVLLTLLDRGMEE